MQSNVNNVEKKGQILNAEVIYKNEWNTKNKNLFIHTKAIIRGKRIVFKEHNTEGCKFYRFLLF